MNAPDKFTSPAALTRALRSALLANQQGIPVELKDLKAWVLWRLTKIDPNTGKFNKIPSYPNGEHRNGEQGSPEDRVQLGTFEEAIATFNRDPRYAGLGLAMLPGMGYVALDVDHCIPTGGGIPEWLMGLVDDTYAEISPSGTGIRAFWYGTAANGRNIPKGVELYAEKQFVTVTGNAIPTTHFLTEQTAVAALSNELRPRLEAMCQADQKKATKSNSERIADITGGDRVLTRLDERGMVEREMGGGKYSIRCPFEEDHSDPDRAPGDGDTVYFVAHTNGYAKGHFHCAHSHCADRDDSEFLRAIDLGPSADGFDIIEEWPDPAPLPDDLPPVKQFDLEMLPEKIRLWIADIAERMQIAPDVPALGAVTALSSAIGRRVRIMPKAHDDWTVTPNLWGMVVAPPGFLKSPALSEIMRPLHLLEKAAHAEYEAAIAVWAANAERISIANSAAREKAKAAYKKDAEAVIPDPQPEPEQPRPRRNIVNNFSMEAVGEVLMGNPNGVLAFSDEIHGLLQMALKPGNEGLNDFLLSAWNGDSPFTFDRIGRGLNRRIENVCMSVLGGIQPGRLMEYVTGAVHGGSNDSGLLQRFQLLCWPDMPKQWRLVDRQPNRAAQETASQVFQRIAGCDDFSDEGGNSVDIRRFDSTAQTRFYEWLEELEMLVRGDSLHPFMQSHLSKFRSLVPSLALIFAVADGVDGDIALPYLESAIRMAEYLRSHAERVYAVAVQPATRNARALLAKIKSGDVVDGFAARDVYRNGWTLLDREGTDRAIGLLCDFDYIVAGEFRSADGGRPKLIYRINPNTL